MGYVRRLPGVHSSDKRGKWSETDSVSRVEEYRTPSM